MKRMIPFLLVLALLLAGLYSEDILTEKKRMNPIPEGTTALILTPADGSTKPVTITDAQTISALRRAYRWTNAHLHCCLDGEVEATVSIVVNGVRRSSEPDKVYADLSIPSYNRAFRNLLHNAWSEAASR